MYLLCQRRIPAQVHKVITLVVVGFTGQFESHHEDGYVGGSEADTFEGGPEGGYFGEALFHRAVGVAAGAVDEGGGFSEDGWWCIKAANRRSLG